MSVEGRGADESASLLCLEFSHDTHTLWPKHLPSHPLCPIFSSPVSIPPPRSSLSTDTSAASSDTGRMGMLSHPVLSSQQHSRNECPPFRCVPLKEPRHPAVVFSVPHPDSDAGRSETLLASSVAEISREL